MPSSNLAESHRHHPTALLLKHLGTHRLVLTGVTSDPCALATTADAKESVPGVRTTPVARVRLAERS